MAKASCMLYVVLYKNDCTQCKFFDNKYYIVQSLADKSLIRTSDAANRCTIYYADVCILITDLYCKQANSLSMNIYEIIYVRNKHRTFNR